MHEGSEKRIIDLLNGNHSNGYNTKILMELGDTVGNCISALAQAVHNLDETQFTFDQQHISLAQQKFHEGLDKFIEEHISLTTLGPIRLREMSRRFNWNTYPERIIPLHRAYQATEEMIRFELYRN